jgi:beta-galactosidase/beta-glucuronidase
MSMRRPSLIASLALLGLLLLPAAAVTLAQAPASGVPRAEYPRPDLARAEWQTLNGRWAFEFDDQDRGLADGWYRADPPARFSKTIVVPYAFQTKLSGIADPSFHDVVWYRRTFQVPDALRAGGRRVMLNFGAVDYEAIVWVNGVRVGANRGGQVPFGFDVTDVLTPGDNTVTVRAFDPSEDRTIPRGKQYWKPQSEAIWYTRTTGIWQPVWIEGVAPTHVVRLRITPDVDAQEVHVEAVLNRPAPDARIRFTASLRGDVEAQSEISARATGGANPATTLRLDRQETWSPERPTLYDLRVEIVDANGQPGDRVDSYFGQRKVSVHGDRIYLNNAPYYLRMVLDQGYWPESTLTPPSEEAIKHDIEMTKAFGLNGARKHQKVEDPRWLYWCDKLGLIVWGEMANAYDIYTDDYLLRFTDEWQRVVMRDYNHPSIIAWTPINESWGAPRILTDARQQAHARSLYYLTHALDRTRLVQDNDGWEHTDATDIFGIHDYARTGELLAAKYEGLQSDRSHVPRNGREAVANGFVYNGTPIVLTEFGGISYRLGAQRASNEWGYSGIEPTAEAFEQRLDGLLKAIRANKAIAGFCYTQLTDVEQEINGLMTYERKPKLDPKIYARIFGQ